MGALDLIAMAAKAGKKSAPFFSKADAVLDELQRGKGTGDEFLTELVKKGAKPTELRERGIEGALKGKPKMTKAEVKKVFEEKAPPKIKEEIRGGDEYKEALDEKAREIIGDEYATFDDLYGRDREYAKFSVEKDFGYTPETKHEEWRTPGGQNYREILLKIPQRGLNEAEQRILMNYEADVRRGEQLNPWHQRQYNALKAKEAMGNQDYMSSHWKDTPNVLAHIRVQDFKTPEGKKVLLVDEIQSDWHQEGRKKGYKNEEQRKNLLDRIEEAKKTHQDFLQEMKQKYGGEGLSYVRQMTDEEKQTARTLANESERIRQELPPESSLVPDAPFKKNWHELAMKRVLDYAAENGYDTVAITPGAEQAKRYDLSKHISDLEWDSQTGKLNAWDHSGNKVISQGNVSQEDLPNYIGKEAAQKLLEKENPIKQMFGADLQVGGEGMKGFYDKILPDYLNNFGKQYGSGVGEIDIITKPSQEIPQIAAPGLGHFPEPIIEPAKTMKAWSFDITPQLREEIKTKGLPLYSKTGMGPEGLAAGTGAATIGAEALTGEPEQQVQNPVHFTENPDAMLLDLMQRN